MLGRIFYWVFNMSIASIICGIPVLILRRIKRIPRRVSVFLWLIPYIRMCIPFGFSAKYGLMALISKFTTKTVVIPLPLNGSTPKFTGVNFVMGASGYFPITYKVDYLERLFDVASVIWIIIALSGILAWIIVYSVTMHTIKDSQKIKDNIFVSDRINATAVYGIIKPRILLPRGYREDGIEYVLMHENTHIKRRDNAVRIAALFISCLHWFNPFSWLCLKLLYSDIELACDETVLSKLSGDQKKSYANALLSAAEGANAFASPFGGANIRLRIENILTYRKLSAASVIAFSAMIMAALYILLTNA